MATANRHRRASRWNETVAVRLLDVATINIRAIFKMLGKQFRMVDLKRLIACGLALHSVRDEIITDTQKCGTIGHIPFTVQGPDERLNNRFHYSGQYQKCKQCRVHQQRCETKKCCLSCDVPLCNDIAWARFHTLEEYKL